MLDIHFIRENQEIVRMSNARRGVTVDLKKLIALDDERIAVSHTERTTEKYQKLIAQWRKMMLSVPNILDISVPEKERIIIERAVPNTVRVVPNIKPESVLYSQEVTDYQQKIHAMVIATLTSESDVLRYAQKSLTSLDQTERSRVLSELPLHVPSRALVMDTGFPYRVYMFVHEGKAVLMDSLVVFDALVKAVTTIVTELCSEWTQYVPAAPETAIAAAKECRWEMKHNGSTLDIAKVSFERDYTSRQAGRTYAIDGGKRYAHTVIAQIDLSLLR